MKNLIKNKKFLICITSVLIILLIIGGLIVFKKVNKDDNPLLQTGNSTSNNYVAYLKINPSIKIEYTQTCKNVDNKNEFLECEDPIVTKYELINEDAKNIYKDIDLLGSSKDLFKVLNLICETAKDNGIVFENVEIYSNWENIKTYINNQNGIDDKITFNIEITNKENIDKKVESDQNNIINYNVSFDTDGGNNIESQVINKDEKVTKPTNPTRDGYNFIEWQLNGKKFDFKQEINSDIKLIAKWEKIESSDNSSNKKENSTNTNNTTNNQNTNNNSNKNENSTNNNSNNNQNTNESTNTTPNEEDTHKGFINLNDNVQYYKGTSCGGYQAIKSSCLNKTYRELMAEFPDNYNTSLNDPENLEWLDEVPYEKYSLVEYFPGCKTTVSSSIQNTINNTPGFYGEFRDNGFMKPNWIYFTDAKYNKFKGETNNFEKYGIYDITACGGAGDGALTYYTLDETACKKYNLSCDRW